MNNPIKVFGAGLASWFEYTITNWKKVLLIAALIPVALVAWVAIMLFVGTIGFHAFISFVIWSEKTFPSFWKWEAAHPLEFVCMIFGGMILWVISLSIYKSGKDRLTK